MPDITCPFCGASNFRYPSQASQKFCNNDCYQAHHRQQCVAVKCPSCGITNYKSPSTASRKFCNNDCYQAYHRQQCVAVKCPSCGTTNYKSPSTAFRKFCNKDCQDAYHHRSKVVVKCPNCGTANYQKPSTASRKYCNKDCFNSHFKSRHIGERYGRYTIIDVTPDTGVVLAECSCGTIKAVKLGSLVSSETVSCGCHSREMASKTAIRLKTTHGLSKHPAYIRYLKRLRRERDSGWTFDMDKALRDLQPTCVICGSDDRLAIDHVVSFIKKGCLNPGNACVLCVSCNSAKGAKTLEELPLDWQTKIRKAAQEFYDVWMKQC